MKKAEALLEMTELVEHYRNRIGVDPRIQISIEWEKDTDCFAKVNQSTRRPCASLVIGQMYTTQSLRDRRQTAIHELLHIAQKGPFGTVLEGLDELDSETANMLWRLFLQQHEVFTDTLAEALVDELELPA